MIAEDDTGRRGLMRITTEEAIDEAIKVEDGGGAIRNENEFIDVVITAVEDSFGARFKIPQFRRAVLPPRREWF
ncbi:MAG: hypothetical protein AB7U82_04535 [Blastocatellales bacterium]